MQDHYGVLPSPTAAAGFAKAPAVAAGVLLGVTTFVYLFAVYAGFVEHGVSDDLFSHSAAELHHADVLYSSAGHVQMIALLLTAPVFITWFYRVRTAADFLAADACTRGRGWAVGGWFIPVGSLWIPYRIANEIWTAGSRTAPDGSGSAVSRRPLALWWGVWITSIVIGRIGSSLKEYAATGAEFQRGVDAGILSDALGVVAAVLAIVVVRKLTAMQQAKAAAMPVMTA